MHGSSSLRPAARSGCPWDTDTCSAAAAAGHLAVLQWAVQQGAPWDKAQCAWFAALHKFHDVVDWINAQEDDEEKEWW